MSAGPWVHVFVDTFHPSRDIAVCGECLSGVPRDGRAYLLFTTTEIASMDRKFHSCRVCGEHFARVVR